MVQLLMGFFSLRDHRICNIRCKNSVPIPYFDVDLAVFRLEYSALFVEFLERSLPAPLIRLFDPVMFHQTETVHHFHHDRI